MFDQKFFTNNRKALMKSVGADCLVLAANGLLQRNKDCNYKFRQDSSFWYLTGVNEPDYLLVIAKDVDYLVKPPRERHRDLWEGELIDAEQSKLSGINNTVEYEQGLAILKDQISRSNNIGIIKPSPEYLPAFGMYTNPTKSKLLSLLKQQGLKNDTLDIQPYLSRLRQNKQDCEIAAIKSAISVTKNAIDQLKTEIYKMSSEQQVAAFISYIFASQGCDNGFEPTIATGKNATIIHNRYGDTKIKDYLIIDIGAEYSMYSADISRTFALTVPSKRLRQVYDAVADVQAYAMSILKSGVKLADYEQQVAEKMAEQLIKLKLISSPTKQDIRRYFPHATSHFLGLDTHDDGDYFSELTANTVVTVEPGIYIPEEGIGVRIEDDVLITKNSCINLSSGIDNNLLYYH